MKYPKKFVHYAYPLEVTLLIINYVEAKGQNVPLAALEVTLLIINEVT